MDLPDTLRLKVDRFARDGRHVPRDMDLFALTSWVAVHLGQGNDPAATDPLLAHQGDPARSRTFVERLAAANARAADGMPTHAEQLRGLAG